jgi:osmoprotectant transport system ATP-binding protein
VLLMDEPFGALDPVTRVGIRKEFRELDELKKKTILMVTHDVQEAFELSDRICLMDKGKIVQIGKSTELLFNPANSFVASFLKEQRFQLELESILVKDIWTLLSKAIDGTDEKLVSTGDNLWNLLEMISTGRSEYQRYVAVEDGEKKQIDAASLMAAYTQYKSVHKYE